MNKKLKIALTVAVLSVTSLYATDSKIGTESDPLVTKSYVDKKIADIAAGGTDVDFDAVIATQEKLIIELSNKVAALEEAQGGYKIATVQAGQTILGKQGSEIIIRSGEGTIVASAGGGVQDVTDGVDLAGGTKAPNNNLLIVPREDGRGILATRTMVVMVRGGYTIL